MHPDGRSSLWRAKTDVGGVSGLLTSIGMESQVFRLGADELDVPQSAEIMLAALREDEPVAGDNSYLVADIEWTVYGGKFRGTVDVPRMSSILVTAGAATITARVAGAVVGDVRIKPWRMAGQIGEGTRYRGVHPFFATSFALDAGTITFRQKLGTGTTAVETWTTPAGSLPTTQTGTLSIRTPGDGILISRPIVNAESGLARPMPVLGAASHAVVVKEGIVARCEGYLVQWVTP